MAITEEYLDYAEFISFHLSRDGMHSLVYMTCMVVTWCQSAVCVTPRERWNEEYENWQQIYPNDDVYLNPAQINTSATLTDDTLEFGVGATVQEVNLGAGFDTLEGALSGTTVDAGEGGDFIVLRGGKGYRWQLTPDSADPLNLRDEKVAA